MLEREPEKRITMAELKAEKFFAGINWESLIKKQITPPIDTKSYKIDYKEDGSKKHEAYMDYDYSKNNMTDNRLPQITFTNPSMHC